VIGTGDRPTSVTAIAIITLVFAVLVLMGFGILEFNLIYSISNLSLTAIVALVLEIYALVISVLMLVSDSKQVWYSAVIFWILVIITAIFYSIFLSGGFIEYFVLLWTGPPMISSIICLASFHSKKVKNYFGFKLT
jgi:hypothetical protein